MKQVAYFSITGEAITTIARDFWIEGRRNSALKVLNDIEGVDQIMALKIVTGEKKFIGIDKHGENTLELVDDNTTTHRGINISLTYQIEMIEKRMTDESNFLHLMRFPCFHFNKVSGQARVVSKQMYKKFGDIGCIDENVPLESYKKFINWVEYTTDNYNLPAEWTLETTQKIEHWRGHPWQLPSEWKRYSTEEMMEMVDNFIEKERERLLNIEQYLNLDKDRCRGCEFKNEIEEIRKLGEVEKKEKDYEFFKPEQKENKGNGKYKDMDDGMKKMLLKGVADMQMMAMTSGLMLSNDRAAEAVEIQLGIKEAPPTIKTKEANSPSGLLTLEGEYYPCPYMGHREMLHDLDMNDSDVESKGWIEISEMRMRIRNEPTEAQFEFMVKLIKKYGKATVGFGTAKNEEELRKHVETEFKDISDYPKEKSFLPKQKSERDGD